MTKELRPHPDHEWLLLMSDGELPPESRAAMQKHLEACWECRHELQQIEGTISDAVRYRKEVLVRHMPPPPNPWRDLSAGFAQIDHDLAPPSLLSRIRAALRMPRYAIPLAAAALGAAVFLATTRIETEPAPRPDAAAVVLSTERAPAAVETSADVPTVSMIAPASAGAVDEPAVPATAADLAHSAVLVAQLLHQRGADLGDPIEISRTSERVVVRGVGLDSERAHELEPLLKQIPFVEFHQSAAGGPGAATTVGRFAPASGDAPYQKELARELGGQPALDSLAAESLDHAELLMERAHALRRLADQFSSIPLTPEDLRAVQALRGEHAKAMVAEIARVERVLAPAIRALAAAPGPLLSPSPTEENLLASARRLESSIAELTGAKAVAGSVDQLPTRLATDLASVAALARSFASRN